MADAIVVAAGGSQRMSGLDKLAVPIAGRPLLAWTLAAIARAPEIERVVVVTGPAKVDEIAAAPWLPPKVATVVAGGPRRQESVAAGVRALAGLTNDGAAVVPAEDDRIILVHDGARPLVSTALVSAVARAAAIHGAALPVVPVAETLKRIEADEVAETVDRSQLAVAQTPQGMRRSLLMAAYERFPPGGPPDFTDEAALLEACRIAVHAIPGEPGNLKVTVPDDLTRAAAVLAAPGLRFGIGSDRHPFGPERGLALGGITIDDAPRLRGHSDGDVALHALADALLGAAGLGDLGRLFPADDRTPRGVASRELLSAVVGHLADRGYRPVSADLTIVAARPRLGERLEVMRTTIASLLDLDPAFVSVKASTGNLGGDDGAGRAISAQAVAGVVSQR